MAKNDVPLDDKAKRMRDLLSSFYSTDHASGPDSINSSSKFTAFDSINTSSFDPDVYMNHMVQKSNLEILLQRHVEMAAEIKNLDTDLQMLVYENYNKFISATETMKRMKNNISGMETNMEQLLEKILSVQSRSAGVNTSLFEKREHIERLHRTRNLLRKVQFIYDLPEQLARCIKSESYADAVRFYTGAMPIFKAYGDSSFKDCKRASEEAVAVIVKNLQGKIFSDSESIQARAEAVMLLKHLDFPVGTLKEQLLEKLDLCVGELQLPSALIRDPSANADESPKPESSISLSAAHEVSTREFVEAVRAYRVIFPDSEDQLIKISQNLITKHFETIQEHLRKPISSADFLGMLKLIWTDVLLMDEVLPEAALPEICLEGANLVVKQFIASTFGRLHQEITESLMKVQISKNEAAKDDHILQITLEGSKKTVIQGCMGTLLEFRQLVDDSLALMVRLRDFIIDWVQEGFQNFFKTLHYRFVSLSGRSNLTSQDALPEAVQGDKVVAGLVLVLAQLCVFIEQNAIPRITEEIGTSFSDGGVRGSEYGPAFLPGDICRLYRSTGESFLHFYIKIKTQRVSVLLRKRFTAPNWVKHKEPRDVHMFVDLFLQEVEGAICEVNQILPEGTGRKHRRTDSNGSTTSSRSNPLRDDRLTRSNPQKGRSQLLESHLAKLFKQKIEISTKVEFTQDSVINTIMKLCLKSLQEFVRLQTFNRSGFQQIQLDVHYLRVAVKDTVDDEASVDFLLDEVVDACAERCLDPISLEPPILDRLVVGKLEKVREQKIASA
ncbi:hypothetical protein V2J09_003229 [Rumex salicifolius]